MKNYYIVEWDESGAEELLRFNSLKAQSDIEAIGMASGTYDAEDFVVSFADIGNIPQTREGWERVLKRYYPDTNGVIIYVEGLDAEVFYPDGSHREISI